MTQTYEIFIERTVVPASGPHRIVVDRLGIVETDEPTTVLDLAAQRWKVRKHTLHAFGPIAKPISA